MPWTSERFPPAMDHLPEPVRRKAIAIANALLEDGHDEGFCIRVAISRARQWAEHRSPASEIRPAWPPD